MHFTSCNFVFFFSFPLLFCYSNHKTMGKVCSEIFVNGWLGGILLILDTSFSSSSSLSQYFRKINFNPLKKSKICLRQIRRRVFLIVKQRRSQTFFEEGEDVNFFLYEQKFFISKNMKNLKLTFHRGGLTLHTPYFLPGYIPISQV